MVTLNDLDRRNGRYLALFRISAEFGSFGNHVKVVEVRPVLCPTAM